MSLYDRVAAKRGGESALAVARLRREIIAILHEAFQMSEIPTQSDLARRLGVRRSAVNQVFRSDGNLRTNTVAEYLFAMGFELEVKLVEAGEPRRAEVTGSIARSVAVIQYPSTVPSTMHPFGAGTILVNEHIAAWPGEIGMAPHHAFSANWSIGAFRPSDTSWSAVLRTLRVQSSPSPTYLATSTIWTIAIPAPATEWRRTTAEVVAYDSTNSPIVLKSSEDIDAT